MLAVCAVSSEPVSADFPDHQGKNREFLRIRPQISAITLQSRLSCQCVPDGSTDLVVEIPEWNKNLVKEGH